MEQKVLNLRGISTICKHVVRKTVEWACTMKDGVPCSSFSTRKPLIWVDNSAQNQHSVFSGNYLQMQFKCFVNAVTIKLNHVIIYVSEKFKFSKYVCLNLNLPETRQKLLPGVDSPPPDGPHVQGHQKVQGARGHAQLQPGDPPEGLHFHRQLSTSVL